jgi:preprotein translocase subunit SecD
MSRFTLLIFLGCWVAVAARAGFAQELGKILVYEIEVAPGAVKPDADDVNRFVETLRRRIDPDRLHNIAIRLSGKNRVELTLGYGDDPATKKRGVTKEEIQRIKDLVAKVGHLEFRVLANNVDDGKALADVRAFLNDPARRRELENCQNKGLPPPVPLTPRGEAQTYRVKLAKHESVVTYGWVELGPQERRALNLDNAAAEDPKRDVSWKQLAKARSQATTVANATGALLYDGALFFSRPCTDRALPEEDRKAKTVEYFVLARHAEIDPQTGKPTPALTGAYLKEVYAESDDLRNWVSFTLTERGGELLANLSRKNVSGSEKTADGVRPLRRRLAIILGCGRGW